jgi:osmotically-inducible protein OsmY
MSTAMTKRRTDEDLQQDVLDELKWDARVRPNEIEVRLPTTAKRTDADLAEAAVQALEWVVRPPQRPTPDELKRQVEQALIRSAQTDAERITVDVRRDTVILSGTVRSWAEREEAERVSWSAPGISKVENRITVNPWND